MDLGSLIAALILGFVCGAIARALVPNDAFQQMEGWRSWAASTVLGLIGALVGYLVFAGLFGIGDDDAFDWGGIVGASSAPSRWSPSVRGRCAAAATARSPADPRPAASTTRPGPSSPGPVGPRARPLT